MPPQCLLFPLPSMLFLLLQQSIISTYISYLPPVYTFKLYPSQVSFHLILTCLFSWRACWLLVSTVSRGTRESSAGSRGSATELRRSNTELAQLPRGVSERCEECRPPPASCWGVEGVGICKSEKQP